MYSAVLTPLDGSKAAASAIPPALELAQALSARLVLMKVLPAVDEADGQRRREHEALRFQTEAYLESLKRSLRNRGVRIDCVVSRGDPAPVILETAQSLGDALLVITARGMAQPDSECELGRVAEQVLRKAQVPVVLIRPRTEIQELA